MRVSSLDDTRAPCFRVSCRARMDEALTAKENKDRLKDEVARALEELGLAIDVGDVRFHHFKTVRKRNRQPKWVVMGLEVVEGAALQTMMASPAFSASACGSGGFTVRWVRSTDEEEEEEGEVGAGGAGGVGGVGGVGTADVGVGEEGVGAGARASATQVSPRKQKEKEKNKEKKMGNEAKVIASNVLGASHHAHASEPSSSMTSTLVAGVAVVVSLGCALVLGYHHRGMWTGGLGRAR